MNIFLILAGLWLTGALVLWVARRPSSLRDCVASGPETFAVGVIVCHLLFLLFGLIGHDLPYWMPVLLGAPLLIISGRDWFGRAKKSAAAGEIRGICEQHAWVLLALLLLLFLAPTLTLPLFDWDARILWGYKAKVLAVEGLPSAGAFADPYRLHIHPRYPLLFPWLTALLAKGTAGFEEFHLRLIALLFALMTLWQSYRLVRRQLGWKLALLPGLVLLLTGSWLQSVANAGVEIALAFFGLLAVGRLSAWLEREGPFDLWLSGVFLAGAVMTKNEGLLLAVAVMAALLVVAVASGRVARGAKAVGRVALCAFLLSAPWLVQRSLLPAVSDENYLARLDLETIRFGLGRLAAISRALLTKMAGWSLWHVFWLVLPLWGVLLLVRRPAKIQGLFLLLVLALYCAGIGLVYLISPWRDIAMQIDVTFDRIMLPVLVLGLWLGVSTLPPDRREA